MLNLVCLVSLLSCAVFALPPPYLTPCARDDPNFNVCALQEARKIMPEFVKGDRKNKVPSLDPLHIANIQLDERGFILDLNDVTVLGLKDSDIHDIKYDFENQIYSMYLTVPRLETTGKYNVKGKLLLIPISGNGDVNATLVNTKMWVDVKFQIKTFNGKNYIVKDEPKVRTEPKRAYMHFENLFNGNKALGDQINSFIDENWQDVYKELSPVLMQALGNVIISITNKFERTATFDELFPLKNH